MRAVKLQQRVLRVPAGRERGVGWWTGGAPPAVATPLVRGSCCARAGLLTARSGGRGAAGPVMAPPRSCSCRGTRAAESCRVEREGGRRDEEGDGQQQQDRSVGSRERWNLTGRWEGRKRWLGVGSTNPQPPAGASHHQAAVNQSNDMSLHGKVVICIYVLSAFY
jgi:hypothetical protein